MIRIVAPLAAISAIFSLAAPALAAPPFSEDFSSGVANWRFNADNSQPLDAVGSGGADGGAYISRTGSLPTTDSQVIFRAHKVFNSSNAAYTGDWIAAGATQVAAFIRHNASEPLSFNARFAGENNFPGASYFSTAPVPSGVWTQLTYDITPSSPQLADPSYEGTNSYEAIYRGFDNSGIGNMQFSVVIPESLRGAGPFTFDFDKVVVSVVPEPAAGVLAAAAAAVLGLFARRRG